MELLLTCTPVVGQVRDFSDRILVFHSDITAERSGKLLVVETIKIYNGNGQRSPDIDYLSYPEPNNDIQRGIVRDFPTRYKAKDGFWQKVGFKLKSVTQNGEPANYHTEDLDNGVRIYVGDEDNYLPEGVFTYRFTYETSRQLIYHALKDELYWNVNGNGWVFYADSVSCTIRFPSGSQIFEHACYTGYQGSTDRNCYSTVLDDSTIHFAATRRLEPWQGLTVAAAIHKGIFTGEPPRGFFSIIRDNYGLGILGGTFAGLLLFYYIVWYRRGRDPKKGTIFPQLAPPEDLTAADVGYIAEQRFGPHLFAATLVDMAVKNYLKIAVETKGTLLKRTTYRFEPPEKPGKGDGRHFDALYGFTPSDMHGREIERGKYDASFKRHYDALSEKLAERFKIRRGKKNTWHGLFVLNDGYTGCGGVFV
ncbi:MAG TPA: DUF2207 domain-containing protein, partial [Phnomibacter sp.]|nr:DUF2207 domain-containing protein [Phnomibacter sp.]